MLMLLGSVILQFQGNTLSRFQSYGGEPHVMKRGGRRRLFVSVR